jgi:hypothetical protein
MEDRQLSVCPVCAVATPPAAPEALGPAQALALHFVDAAGRSDVSHVMWLNRNVTKHRVTTGELARLLAGWAAASDAGADRVRR